ncbi:hypothetical protein FRB99_000992 [Tulasnella sp. 403]|nr:hypothetical protein FRB99_000992 [Tulasnella sp. 403]
MSSLEKVVKLACKPKAAPPKPKYIDAIIAATYSEDGAMLDVCKALAPRFREPNAVIVFKALIVLHTMVRNGATDNVLSHLSQSDVLRLRNVSSGQWEGYTAPQNLMNYAAYMDCRIRAYKDLKHDPIRVQSESNRDLRVGAMDDEARRSSLGAGSSTGGGGASLANRRQTIVGRKLRVMSVEKGLLRETKIVQKIIDTLLECKASFYLDDLEDELTIAALRILVKDLLVLWQACNEGVINLLESYFEMSHVDATTALALYRHFCLQAQSVDEYFTIAKKLQNLLNVPIPELHRAPLSLAGSLEEYLNDPNFEQNRIEYKTTKEAAARNAQERKRTMRRPTEEKKAEIKAAATTASTTAATTPTPDTSKASSEPQVKKPEVNKQFADFFSSIEPEQTPSPFVQGSSAFNPFGQVQAALQNSVPGASSPFALAPSPFINVQPTGVPTVLQASPFVNGGVQQSQPTGVGFPFGQPAAGSAFLSPNAANLGPSPFVRPQSAAPDFSGANLQPLLAQPTGFNPFRQSVLAPQATGLPGAAPNPFAPAAPSLNPAITGSPFNMQQPQVQQPFQTTNPFPSLVAPTPTAGTAVGAASTSPFSANTSSTVTAPTKITPPFMRPASTPITGSGNALSAQQTGSKNPFGRPKSPPPPPVPPIPTLGQLATGAFGSTLNGVNTNPASQTNSSPFASNSSPFGGLNLNGTSSVNGTASATAAKPVSLSSVASEFTFDAKKPSSPPPGSNLSSTGLFGSSASPFAPLTSQNTAATNTSNNTLPSIFSSMPTGNSNATSTLSSLKPQATGFGGSSFKPFVPTSSFGASLLESLPPIPQGTAVSVTSSPPRITEPTTNGTTSNSPFFSLGAGGSGGLTGALNAQPTGLSPFSTLGTSTAGGTAGGSGLGAGLGSGLGAGLGSGLQPQATGANPFRASFLSSPGAAPPTGSTLSTGIAPNPTGFGTSLFANTNKTGTAAPSTGFGLFGAGSSMTSNLGSFGSGGQTQTMPGAFPGLGQPQQQQNVTPSLI